jgi:hypothetical protein
MHKLDLTTHVSIVRPLGLFHVRVLTDISTSGGEGAVEAELARVEGRVLAINAALGGTYTELGFALALLTEIDDVEEIEVEGPRGHRVRLR